VLAGRQPQQSTIRDRISRVAQFGEYAGPLLVFHGPRGVGKTSLLRDGQHQAEVQGFLTAWVSCTRRKPFLPDIASRVTRALTSSDAFAGKKGAQVGLRLERITAQMGPSVARLSASFAAATPAHSQPEQATMSAVEDLLHEASRAVRSVGGAGLVLFVDELHAAHQSDLAVLLNALQNLEGRRSENPLTVMTAGLPSTPGWITKAATFGERSTFERLDRLDAAGALEAVSRPAAGLGVEWSSSALALVASEADGFPHLLQVIAHAVWSTAKPADGDRITEEHVVVALPEASRKLEELYAARWEAAGMNERRIIQAMASQAEDPEQPVSRADISAVTGIETRALSTPRERLIDKGIIEPVAHGLLRFTMPGFGEYVRARHLD